jgi:hypothetical protein
MADTGTGIQELMAAETRASQIVAEARIGTFEMRQIAFTLGRPPCVFIPPPQGRHQVHFPCLAARRGSIEAQREGWKLWLDSTDRFLGSWEIVIDEPDSSVNYNNPPSQPCLA